MNRAAAGVAAQPRGKARWAMVEWLLYLAAGTGAGLLAGLFGVGGGIVMVPLLYFAFRSQGFAAATLFQCATATSLAAIIASGLSALAAHGRRHNVDWRPAGLLALGAALGAAAVASWAVARPGAGWRVCFGLFLWSAAWLVSRRPHPATRVAPPYPATGRWLAIGLASGALSAAFGVGGGVVAVPLMGVLLHVEFRRAVGNATAVLASSAIISTAVYLVAGQQWIATSHASLGLIHLPSAVALALAATPAAQVGGWLAHRLPERLLRTLFVALLLLTGGGMVLG